MTAHPIDTEALRKQYAHLVEKYGPEAWAESRAHVVLSLLDELHEEVRENHILRERLAHATGDAEFWESSCHQADADTRRAREGILEQTNALAAAEHRATRAEAQSAIRGRAVVIYRERAREAEAERDWNLRSSRLAKEERIKATARADEAEARIKAWAQQYDYDMGHEVSRAEEAETRIRAVEDVLDRSRDDIAMHTYPEQLNADIRRALNGGQ